MRTITRISTNKRQPNRRTIYIDGAFAFACSVNVVARFRLREGMSISEANLEDIQHGELQQKCMDRAMQYIQTRLHSREELLRKLKRAQFPLESIDRVLAELTTLGYVNDERFAQVHAAMAQQHKQHGRRRALMDLRQRGVAQHVAERALSQTYQSDTEQLTARRLAEKHALRLSRLEPQVARRRLAGLLSRRGFDYEQVSSVIDAVLGSQSSSEP